MESPDLLLLFLLFSLAFKFSKYHFSQMFRTSFNIIWKKDFGHNFSFFNEFTQVPPPAPSLRPKSAKLDESSLGSSTG